MKINNIRRLAKASILLTPIVLIAVTAYRWRTGSCAGNVHGSVWLLMVFAASLVMSKNPYSAIAACLAYLPVGYIFSTEPCTAPRSQGAGGLIYLMAPLFIGFVLFGTMIGDGFYALYLVSRMRRHYHPRSAIPTQAESKRPLTSLSV